jgi:hypothetical protein
LLTTGNSPARSPTDGAFDSTSQLTQQRWSGNCDKCSEILRRFASLGQRWRGQQQQRNSYE